MPFMQVTFSESLVFRAVVINLGVVCFFLGEACVTRLCSDTFSVVFILEPGKDGL